MNTNQENFVICGQKSFESNLIWGCILGNRIVCMVDENLVMKLESVECLFSNFAGSGSLGGQVSLPRERLVNSILKSEDGIVFKAVLERIRNLGDSVGFIGDSGIVKVRLLRLEELATLYVEKGKWLPALRLCVDICRGLVAASYNEKASIKRLCKDLTSKYISHFLKTRNQEETLLCNIIRVSIDALNSAGFSQEIFEIVQPKFKPFLFWKEIENFVKFGKIVKIPISSLIQASLYLDRDIFESLLLNLEMEELQENDEHFNELLMAVKKRKFWISFTKISLKNPQFCLKLFLSSMLAEAM